MSGLGKTFAQIQAEQMAEGRFADLMSAGGIGSHQMAQELLFFLPKDFRDSYAELFYKAFAGKDDGGVNQRGQSAAAMGELQKGKAAAKTNGKKFKKYWVIASEDAVALRDKVDKRLRAMARDMRDELELMDEEEVEGTREGRRKVEKVRRCEECGRLLQVGWKFCPNDGALTTRVKG